MTDLTNTRNKLRTMVRSAYDLQKLRIATGLRLCANFRSKLGQDAGTTEEELDEDAKKVLTLLRESYQRLTDGIARNRILPPRDKFKGDQLITEYTELMLVAHYLDVERVERRQFTDLTSVLVEFPIFNQFLEKVRGCGPAMSAVIISEFDIHKAKYISSMWMYAGLDIVKKWRLKDLKWTTVNPGQPRPDIQLEREVPWLLRADGSNGPVTVDDETRWVSFRTDDDLKLTPTGEEGVTVNGQIGTLSCQKNGYILEAEYHQYLFGGRSKRKAHLVKRQYIDKNGEMKEKDSITYNPFLKTKLVGVLGSSFLRSGSPYKKVYDDYKHRLETTEGPPHEWSKKHRHNAAIRYMVKMFIKDLYIAWRPMEGLPVHPSYQEAKLGHAPHSRPPTTEAEAA